MGKQAAGLALDGRAPRTGPSGKLPVIFSPDAFSNLLGTITVPAIYGEAVHRFESAYSGKLGEQVASQRLSILDDGLFPGGLGTSAADDEGIPSRRNVIIEKGVLNGFLYDVYTASEFGQKPTGSATKGSYRSPPDTGARNILVECAPRNIDALISEIDEGLLVHEVLGAHTSNPVSGEFSVSSSLLFHIKRGELAGALKPLMLSGNFPELLKSITGTGKDRKKVPGYPPIITGSVSIDGVMVTG